MSEDIDRIAASMRRAEEKMEEVEHKIFGKKPLKRPTANKVYGNGAHLPKVVKAVPSVENRVLEANTAIASFLSRDDKEKPKCTPDMWDTTDGELQQLMMYVLSSAHVTANERYADTAARISFVVARDTHDVNAFATVAKEGELIVLLGGAIRMANLLAAAYVGSTALKDSGKYNGNLFAQIVASMGQYCLKCKAAISPKAACRFGEDHNLHLIMADATLGRRARSFAAGMIVGVLAHEFGHLALGHCHGTRPNLEVSRNMEREADSFASSIISSSPFGDYLIFGSILWESVWVWVQDTTGEIESSHPLSRERLSDLIRANPSTADELGIGIPIAKEPLQIPGASVRGNMPFTQQGLPRNSVMFRLDQMCGAAHSFMGLSGKKVTIDELKKFFSATSNEIEQFYELARNSSVFTEVDSYRDKLGRVSFAFDELDDDGDLSYTTGVQAEFGLIGTTIKLEAAFVRYAQLAALLLVKDKKYGTHDLDSFMNDGRVNFDDFTFDHVVALADRFDVGKVLANPRARRMALTISGGMLLLNVASEVALVALRYVSRSNYNYDELCIEQVQDADQMAFRVVEQSDFSSTLLESQLLRLFLISKRDIDEEPSYPFGMSRFAQFVADNSGMAKKLGVVIPDKERSRAAWRPSSTATMSAVAWWEN